MIADHDQVGALAAELPEKFELRDVGVLEFVDQDVAVARAQGVAQGVIVAEAHDGVHDLRAEGQQLAVAQQQVAGAVGARDFQQLGDFLVADGAFGFVQRAADAAKAFRLLVGIALVIVRGNQFVLAAREKIHEVAQELSGLGEAPEVVELEQGQVAAQQDPVVHFVDGLEFGIDFLQQGVAKGVKGAERHGFGAFSVRFTAVAGGGHHAMLHLRGRFVREGQAQDFLAGELRLGVEQVTDALGDDARFPRARAGHHHQRALAVMHGGALFRIQLDARGWSAGMFKEIGHV